MLTMSPTFGCGAVASMRAVKSVSPSGRRPAARRPASRAPARAAASPRPAGRTTARRAPAACPAPARRRAAPAGQRQQLPAGLEAGAFGMPRTRFIGGEPMKLATKVVAGPVVDLFGRAELLHAAGVHDDHALRQRHRLDLVVGDEERGDAAARGAASGSRAGSARAAWRRGWTAARRTGTPAAGARSRGPWPRAGAGRRRARAACARSRCPSSRIFAALSTRVLDLGLGHLGDLQAVGHVVEHLMCG